MDFTQKIDVNQKIKSIYNLEQPQKDEECLGEIQEEQFIK